MRTLRTEWRLGAALAGLLTFLLVPPVCRSQDAPPASSESGYGHVSTVEGAVTLLESDTGASGVVEGTEALLVGDELRLAPGARAEVQLADRNVLRLADQAEIAFLALAGSPDRSDEVTSLQLGRGVLQVVVVDDYLGEMPPAIETFNAYVELRGPGSYVIAAQGPERTLIVVRGGAARVRAGTAVTPLGAGDEAVVEGTDGARVRLAAARSLLAVERWGDELDGRYAAVTEVYVDESIRYAAAPLRSYGTWLQVRGTRAWRPRVASGWRPYTHGRWRPTPTGVLWVSYEPWGWVPHHYGSWDLVPGFGWVWFPGRRFAPAWVYWYWGPRYVGWVPWGYYSRHYRGGYGGAFRVVGWAGGLSVRFGDWCFTPIHRFGHRHQRKHIRYGRDLDRGRERIAKGIITTDTRGLAPIDWTSPERVSKLLAYDDRGHERPLEDVSPFIDRQRRRDLADGWESRAGDPGSPTRASIDRVRPTRLAGVTVDPASTRESAREDLKRRASIDRVRPTRTLEASPAPSPATARPIVERQRPSQPRIEERSGRQPKLTRPDAVSRTKAPSKTTRPDAVSRTKAPSKTIRPDAVTRTKPTSTAAGRPQKVAGSPSARPSTVRSAPRPTFRPAARSKPARARQDRARAN